MKTSTVEDGGEPPPPPMWTVLLLSFGVFCVFFCFIPTQTFAALVFPDIGALSVALIYTIFLFGIIFSPTLLNKYDPGTLVAVGSALYVPVAVSVAVESKALLVIGSVCCGAGASLLWNGIGVILTALSNQSTRGRRSGLFAFLNRLNFTSNIFLGILLATGIKRGTLFIFVFSFGILGTGILAVHAKYVSGPLVKKMRSLDKNTDGGKAGTNVERTGAAGLASKTPVGSKNYCSIIVADAVSALVLVKNKDFFPYLVSNYAVYGVLKGFVYSTMTLWFKAGVGGEEGVAFLVGTYGFALVVCTALFGYMFDFCAETKERKATIFVFPVVIAWAGAAISMYAHLGGSSVSPAVWYIASGMIGAGNGGVEGMGYAYTSYLFPNKSSVAFAFAAKLYMEVIGQVIGFLIPATIGDNPLVCIWFLSLHFAVNIGCFVYYLVQHSSKIFSGTKQETQTLAKGGEMSCEMASV